MSPGAVEAGVEYSEVKQLGFFTMK
jgi:hypothetical protein